MIKFFSASIILMLISIFLISCGDAARVVHPGAAPDEGVGSTLQAIGHLGMWAGALGVAACSLAMLASVLSIVSSFLGIRPFLVDGIVLSAALLLVGASFDFLGEHPWLLGVALGLVGALLLIRYRLIIERDLGIAPAVPAPAPAVKP
jgi:hypothetical protein